MNNSIYYSRLLKILIIKPNMGSGVIISNDSIQIRPVLYLTDLMKRHADFNTKFVLVKGVDIS